MNLALLATSVLLAPLPARAAPPPPDLAAPAFPPAADTRWHAVNASAPLLLGDASGDLPMPISVLCETGGFPAGGVRAAR